MSEKSRHLATFALCGFANLTSVTIIMGAVSSLSEEITIDRIRGPCWRGLLVGIFTGLFNASVAGIINIEQISPSLSNSTLSADDLYWWTLQINYFKVIFIRSMQCIFGEEVYKFWSFHSRTNSSKHKSHFSTSQSREMKGHSFFALIAPHPRQYLS